MCGGGEVEEGVGEGEAEAEEGGDGGEGDGFDAGGGEEVDGVGEEAVDGREGGGEVVGGDYADEDVFFVFWGGMSAPLHHFPGMTLASIRDAFAAFITDVNKSISVRSLAITPTTLSIPTFPLPSACALFCPSEGIRPRLGLKPWIPLHIAGMRTLPPTSVPIPKTDPHLFTRTPSPPLLPPAVHSCLFCGLSVRPKILLTLSSAINVCGTLVLQCITAPASSSISTVVAFLLAGLAQRDAMPMLLSMSFIQKLSLTEIGRPCRGPRGVPVRARWASRKEARERARGKRGSVRQLVN